MRNIPRRSMDRIDQEINVSPLIDVVFILLIFFIVSATFVSVPGIEVNRPKVQTATSLQRNSILFALSNENQLFHGGQEIQLDEMGAVIENSDKKRDKPVIIQVDQWADASILAKVVAQARKSRSNVSIATRKPS
ncbi:MAG: biopolymer transporter ExbD [Verrucomicrobiota bacterium]|nr:biopolymer transporter ExbD [Verrucomicrobiota bacterium]